MFVFYHHPENEEELRTFVNQGIQNISWLDKWWDYHSSFNVLRSDWYLYKKYMQSNAQKNSLIVATTPDKLEEVTLNIYHERKWSID